MRTRSKLSGIHSSEYCGRSWNLSDHRIHFGIGRLKFIVPGEITKSGRPCIPSNFRDTPVKCAPVHSNSGKIAIETCLKLIGRVRCFQVVAICCRQIECVNWRNRWFTSILETEAGQRYLAFIGQHACELNGDCHEHWTSRIRTEFQSARISGNDCCRFRCFGVSGVCSQPDCENWEGSF